MGAFLARGDSTTTSLRGLIGRPAFLSIRDVFNSGERLATAEAILGEDSPSSFCQVYPKLGATSIRLNDEPSDNL